MEEDLRTLILAGNAPVGGVHWVQRPQKGPLPSIVLFKVTALYDYTMDGPSGLVSSRVQMDCYALKYSEVKDCARDVIGDLSGYRGAVGETFFQMIAVEGERDLFDAGSNDAERFYRVSIDLLITHGSA